MAKVFAAFVRHGDYRQPPDTPGALLPWPLTEYGAQQAATGAEAILDQVEAEGWKIDPVIDTSPVLRAWQTAWIMAEFWRRRSGRRLRLVEVDDLTERRVGALANLTMDEIDQVLAADPRTKVPPRGWKSDSFYRLPVLGAESMIDAGHRVARHVRRAVAATAESHGGDTPVLKVFVGHGGAFRHAAVCLGVLELADVRGLSMHHCRAVYFEAGDGWLWRQVAGDWKRRIHSAAERLD